MYHQLSEQVVIEDFASDTEYFNYECLSEPNITVINAVICYLQEASAEGATAQRMGIQKAGRVLTFDSTTDMEST